MRTVWLGAALVAVTVQASAKDLYVNNSGTPACSDSTTYANNNADSPWCTIGRAAWGSTDQGSPNSGQAATAGDTVYVIAGTYTAPGTNLRNTPALNPVNTGSSGNPVVFAAQGLVTLTLSSSIGPVIGCYLRSDVTWRGFYIDENNAPPKADTGPIVVWASTRCIIEQCEVSGINPDWGDNHNGIRVEGSDFTILRNNRIHGQRGDAGGANDAGIMLYDSNDTLIEHNELYDVGTGVFVKGQHPGLTQRRTTIRFNHIYNIAHTGITLGPAARDGRTYQNVIRDTVAGGLAGIKLYRVADGEGGQPINEIVTNNTLVNLQFGLQWQGDGQNTLLVNNVVVATSAGSPVWSWSDDNPLSHTFDRNCYVGGSTFMLDAGRSWSYWQGTFEQDPNGVNADPLFVDAAEGNYRLSTESPCLTIGRVVDNIGGTTGDTIPAGAYITGEEIIGPTEGETPTPTDPIRWRVRFRAGSLELGSLAVALVWWLRRRRRPTLDEPLDEPGPTTTDSNRH